MKELVMESPAKINLALEVIDKRADGYHNIETIFQEISLKDRIYISESNSFELTCNNKLVPSERDNIIYTAWELLKLHKKDGNTGVRVHLEKNIPIAAGLAGGSSNAAAMLKGLNEFWNLGLSIIDLIEIGKKIGADVPYFIYGGTAYGTGRGDDLKALSSFVGRHLLLVNTGYGVSTKYIYENLNFDLTPKFNFQPLIQAINNGDDKSVYPLLANRLESVTIKLKPDIQQIKDDMMELGAEVSLMCGSGPTVFGIFDDEAALEKAFIFFKDKFDLVYVSETK